MVSKKALIKAGGRLDEVYRMSYGESDFGMNIKKAGFRVVIVPEAKTYHRTFLPEQNARSFGFDTPQRIYYLIRNRVLFMKRHAPFANFLIYLLFFYPMYVVYFALKIIRYKPDILLGFIKGVFHAYLYVFNLRLDY
jgi:GT2 family glycosyltransferase